jgi:phage shock protein A
MAEEYSGDVLAQKFGKLEATAGADEDLLALKRKMGLAPPEPAPKAVRVDEKAAATTEDAEQDELARALADLEAEEHAELQVKR